MVKILKKILERNVLSFHSADCTKITKNYAITQENNYLNVYLFAHYGPTGGV